MKAAVSVLAIFLIFISTGCGKLTTDIKKKQPNTGSQIRNSLELSWTRPTARVNGAALPLNELGGYKIYMSEKSGNYSNSIPFYITDNTANSIIMKDIPDVGVRYLVMTALDTMGLESIHSMELTACFNSDSCPSSAKVVSLHFNPIHTHPLGEAKNLPNTLGENLIAVSRVIGAAVCPAYPLAVEEKVPLPYLEGPVLISALLDKIRCLKPNGTYSLGYYRAQIHLPIKATGPAVLSRYAEDNGAKIVQIPYKATDLTPAIIQNTKRILEGTLDFLGAKNLRISSHLDYQFRYDFKPSYNPTNVSQLFSTDPNMLASLGKSLLPICTPDTPDLTRCLNLPVNSKYDINSQIKVLEALYLTPTTPSRIVHEFNNGTYVIPVIQDFSNFKSIKKLRGTLLKNPSFKALKVTELAGVSLKVLNDLMSLSDLYRNERGLAMTRKLLYRRVVHGNDLLAGAEPIVQAAHNNWRPSAKTVSTINYEALKVMKHVDASNEEVQRLNSFTDIIFNAYSDSALAYKMAINYSERGYEEDQVRRIVESSKEFLPNCRRRGLDILAGHQRIRDHLSSDGGSPVEVTQISWTFQASINIHCYDSEYKFPDTREAELRAYQWIRLYAPSQDKIGFFSKSIEDLNGIIRSDYDRNTSSWISWPVADSIAKYVFDKDLSKDQQKTIRKTNIWLESQQGPYLYNTDAIARKSYYYVMEKGLTEEVLTSLKNTFQWLISRQGSYSRKKEMSLAIAEHFVFLSDGEGSPNSNRFRLFQTVYDLGTYRYDYDPTVRKVAFKRAYKFIVKDELSFDTINVLAASFHLIQNTSHPVFEKNDDALLRAHNQVVARGATLSHVLQMRAAMERFIEAGLSPLAALKAAEDEVLDPLLIPFLEAS